MKRDVICIIAMCTPLITAQSVMLEGVRAQDLSIQKTEVITDPTQIKIYNQNDFWFPPTNDIAYVPDSQLLAEERYIKPGGIATGLWIVDQRTQQEKKITDKATKSLEWSSDGRYLAYVQFELWPDASLDNSKIKPKFNSERLCIYDSKTNDIIDVASMFGIGIVHKWSSTHNFLAYQSTCTNEKDKYSLDVYDIDNDITYHIDTIERMIVWNFSWAPSGEILAYTKPLEINRYINEEIAIKADVFLVNYDGSGNKQLTNTSEVETFVKWEEMGSKIITEIVRFPEEGYESEYTQITLKW
jgi:Tol biopolymer transport system component